MSISRHIFNEFRPFFRIFDDLSRSIPSSYAARGRYWNPDDFDCAHARRPGVELTEHGTDYVVEAELPGVKKENLDVRIGDQGRSVIIEGHVSSRTPKTESGSAANDNGSTSSTSAEATKTDATTPISSDREFMGSSHFTRTIWLPRPVDSSKVTGNLLDGILTLRIPKAADPGSIKVDIQ